MTDACLGKYNKVYKHAVHTSIVPIANSTSAKLYGN